MNIACDIETAGLAVNTKINYVGFYWEDNQEEYFKCFILPRDLDNLKEFIQNF